MATTTAVAAIAVEAVATAVEAAVEDNGGVRVGDRDGSRRSEEIVKKKKKNLELRLSMRLVVVVVVVAILFEV